jgi:ATP/maltotriose-dependent transcriptional regulator MalT
MPISRVFVTRFFQLATKRRFAEAERVLERIKLKVQETEWNRGYFQALSGILLTQKSNDEYAFLQNLDLNNEKELKKYRREFLKQSRSKIHADYDRGFFSAWADYMRVSIRIRENPEILK